MPSFGGCPCSMNSPRRFEWVISTSGPFTFVNTQYCVSFEENTAAGRNIASYFHREKRTSREPLLDSTLTKSIATAFANPFDLASSA
eukprot:scaffold22145_cov167-Amphora_coffeaeformis.AAC.2